MRAFRNMHSVTVLNVPQLRELSVSVAFVDVKEVKLENASLLGKCEELKRVVEKKRDDVVVRVKDVGVLPVEKRVVEGNDCCCDCDDDCKAASLVVLLMLSAVGCVLGGEFSGVDTLEIVGIVLGAVLGIITVVICFYQACKSCNRC